MQGCWCIFLVQILHVFWSLTYGEHLAHRSGIHTILLTNRVILIINRLIFLLFIAQVLSSFIWRLWQCYIAALEKVAESVPLTDMLTRLLVLRWRKRRYLRAKLHHLSVIDSNVITNLLYFLSVNDFMSIRPTTLLAGDQAWIHRGFLTGRAHTKIVRIPTIVAQKEGI